MNTLFERLRALPASEDAVTSVEYAVVLALILVAIISAIGAVGAETGGMWGWIKSGLQAVGFIQ